MFIAKYPDSPVRSTGSKIEKEIRETGHVKNYILVLKVILIILHAKLRVLKDEKYNPYKIQGKLSRSPYVFFDITQHFYISNPGFIK